MFKRFAYKALQCANILGKMQKIWFSREKSSSFDKTKSDIGLILFCWREDRGQSDCDKVIFKLSLTHKINFRGVYNTYSTLFYNYTGYTHTWFAIVWKQKKLALKCCENSFAKKFKQKRNYGQNWRFRNFLLQIDIV